MMKCYVILLFLFPTCGFNTAGADIRTDDQIIREWTDFYRTTFNLDLDFSEVEIPPYQDGYDRVIVVAEEITCEQIILKMRESFDVLFANSYLPIYFDHQVSSIRNNTKTYAIRVRNSDSSGEYVQPLNNVELFPVDYQKPSSINDITLMERLIFELKYHTETNRHLDVETFTVCNGSHFRKDSLALSPAVGWKTGKGAYYPPFLFISECYSLFTLDGLYSRNVITY